MTGPESDGIATTGPMDVLAFWRAAGPAKWFKKDAAFDAEIAVHDFRGVARGGGRRPRRMGGDAGNGAWRSSSCSTSFRATCSAATRALSQPMRWRAPSPTAPSRAASTSRYRLLNALSSTCRSSTPSSSPTRNAASRWSSAMANRRCAEMGRAARRHHPPFRSFPAPQRRAWPRYHAGRTGFSRRRRLRRLKRAPSG